MKALVSLPPVRRGLQSVTRAAIARTLAAASVRATSAEIVCREMFPDDPAALRIINRAAVPPGKTDGWASDIVNSAVLEFVASLAPASAISRIMSLGIIAPLAGVGGATIPSRSTGPVAAGGVAESDPIPVRGSVLVGAVLQPRKAAVISAFSREVARRSNAQAVMDAILREDAAITLDSAYLSTLGAGDLPQGLLYGVTPIIPDVGEGKSAMLADIAAVASAAAVNSAGDVAVIMSPERAVKVKIMQPDIGISIIPSLAVPSTRIVGLDASALVHAFGGEPEITASEASVIHMSDDPAQISSGGVAAPVRSLWQTDCIGLRMILDLAFTKRTATAAAYIDDIANW